MIDHLTVTPRNNSNTMTETAFQRLVGDEETAQDILSDLEDPEGLVPEGETMDSIDGWEMALTFNVDDIPAMEEELEAMVDGT